MPEISSYPVSQLRSNEQLLSWSLCFSSFFCFCFLFFHFLHQLLCLPLPHCLFPPSLLKSRLPAIKVKYLLLAWLGILIASWVIYMQYASYSELCRGHVCHMVIVSSVSKYCESHPHSVDQDATERLEVKPSVFFIFSEHSVVDSSTGADI